jgi:hypothetical protein
MKKILAMALLLALVAILAVPMAATAATSTTITTTVGGNVSESSISITPPSAIAFGLLSKTTDNYGITKASATSGKVTVVAGTAGNKNWSVKAESLGSNPGFLTSNGTTLTQRLLIGEVLTPSTVWYAAYGAANPTPAKGPAYLANSEWGYTGTGNSAGTVAAPNIDFCALQFVDANDSTVGTFSITMTFTANIVV